MALKFCFTVLLLYMSGGSTFPKEVPVNSLMGVIQHSESFHASLMFKQIFRQSGQIPSSENHSSSDENNTDSEEYVEKRINRRDENLLKQSRKTPNTIKASGHLDTSSLNFTSGRTPQNSTGYFKNPEIKTTLSTGKDIAVGKGHFKNKPRIRPSSKQRKELGPFPNGELPKDVCDRCPVDAQNTSRILPCKCVGNTGSQAGKISISCPDSIINTEQLKGILTENKDYITTHVFRFTLQNSKVDGVISQALWGQLDFVQVLLDNNQFDWVDNKAFANSNETLHYLSLKNNKLKQFTTGTVNELPYLTTLDLSHNNLSVVFTDAFTYKGLQYLDLSYNQITSIGKRSFAELDSLTELNLSKNQITKLDDETFKFNSHTQLSELLVIDIADNAISYIAKTAFAGLFWVQINLQNNQLKTVSEEAFNQVLIDSSYYAVISLMGNPINCDCDVLWIVNSTQVQSAFDNFMCTNLGKPIRDVTADDLGNCTINNESTTSTILYEVPLG